MARIVKLATVYPNVGQRISKVFENSRIDPATNRTIYFEDLDWEINTNKGILSNDLDNQYYTIYKFDLDTYKVHNKDRKGKLTLEEFIEGVKQCIPMALAGYNVKFVADDENKKELKKLVDEGKLNPGNVVSVKIEEKQEINLDPFAGLEEAITDDKEIGSLADLRNKTLTKSK